MTGKAKWREDTTPLGFRMSSGSTSLADGKTAADNWYALALCIFTGCSLDKALRMMDIAPPQKPKNVEHNYEKYGESVFILHYICKVRYVEVSMATGLSYNCVAKAALQLMNNKGERRSKRGKKDVGISNVSRRGRGRPRKVVENA